jgi:hypothetical protein
VIPLERLAELLSFAQQDAAERELWIYAQRDGELLALVRAEGGGLVEIGRIDLDLYTYENTEGHLERARMPPASLRAGEKLREKLARQPSREPRPVA